jgi:hypothetical protein
MKPRVSFIFAWYDFWIGLFWDRYKRRLYIFPVPCFGIVIQMKYNVLTLREIDYLTELTKLHYNKEAINDRKRTQEDNADADPNPGRR